MSDQGQDDNGIPPAPAAGEDLLLFDYYSVNPKISGNNGVIAEIPGAF